jgi:hypothetical protein
MRIVVAFNKRFNMRVVALFRSDLDLVLALQKTWITLALSFTCKDKLRAQWDSVQPFLPEFPVIHYMFGRTRVIQADTVVEGDVVACRLEPWCICEVPEEVVSRVQAWKREGDSHVRLVKLLLIWRRDWRRHVGGSGVVVEESWWRSLGGGSMGGTSLGLSMVMGKVRKLGPFTSVLPATFTLNHSTLHTTNISQHHGPVTDSAQRGQSVSFIRSYNQSSTDICIVAVAPTSSGKMSRTMRSAKTTSAIHSWHRSVAGNKGAI